VARGITRRDSQVLAAAAEARWAAIEPTVIGKAAMKKSYAGAYLEVLRIASVSHNIAIEVRDKEGSERLVRLLNDVGYYLSSEICDLSTEGRTRANKVAKTLGPDAEKIVASLATIGNAFADEGDERNPDIRWHFIELFWAAVTMVKVLGIETPGLKVPYKAPGGRSDTEFWEPDMAQWSDFDVVSQLEQVINDSDFLVVWLMDEERTQTRSLIVTVAAVVSNFAYGAWRTMCPKLPPGDIDPPPALEVLYESGSKARKKTPRNPGSRAERLRARMHGR